MNIPLTAPEGVRLLTQGKYCPEDVTVTPALQTKTASANGAVTPDAGFAGLKQVTVDVPVPEGTVNITANGTYDVEGYAAAEVAVPAPAMQEKTVTVTADGTVEITPDSGYDGLSRVTLVVSTGSGGSGGSSGSGDPTVTVYGYFQSTTYGSSAAYIKFGSAPTSSSDYDYVEKNGSADDGTPMGTEQATVAYIWGCGYKVGTPTENGTLIKTGTSYSSATEVTFTEDTSITLLRYYNTAGGSG